MAKKSSPQRRRGAEKKELSNPKKLRTLAAAIAVRYLKAEVGPQEVIDQIKDQPALDQAYYFLQVASWLDDHSEFALRKQLEFCVSQKGGGK